MWQNSFECNLRESNLELNWQDHDLLVQKDVSLVPVSLLYIHQHLWLQLLHYHQLVRFLVHQFVQCQRIHQLTVIIVKVEIKKEKKRIEEKRRTKMDFYNTNTTANTILTKQKINTYSSWINYKIWNAWYQYMVIDQYLWTNKKNNNFFTVFYNYN